jgi:hypothetical protein
MRGGADYEIKGEKRLRQDRWAYTWRLRQSRVCLCTGKLLTIGGGRGLEGLEGCFEYSEG